MSSGFVLRLEPTAPLVHPLAPVYEALRHQGLFIPDQTWWFAWCETDIRLPRPFNQEVLDPRWEVVRLFSEVAELRGRRLGERYDVWLLTESEEGVTKLKAGLEGFTVTDSRFKAEPGRRILAGEMVEVGVWENGRVMVKPKMVVVAYPRPLDYGVEFSPGHGLEAEVQCYFDATGRLRLVRYCAIRQRPRPRTPAEIRDREVRPL